MNNKAKKNTIEQFAGAIVTTCAIVAIFAVCSITVYMIAKGTPALYKVGVFKLLFGTVWQPTATEPSYGILYIILSSIVGTACSILIGVPVGLLTAVFLTQLAGKRLSAIVQPAIELLAAIPSVIYGLLGLMLLNPVMYRLEKFIFAGSSTHQYTGGANMLSAIIVLAIMILPTVVNISASSMRAVSPSLAAASLALGASRIQTIFRVVIPAAKSGIMTGVVLGIGRALGEAMAINMVAGGAVNIPLPFNSVRFLTTQLVSEMGYASDLHREVLFTVGLVLYVFVIIINLVLMKLRKSGDVEKRSIRKKQRESEKEESQKLFAKKSAQPAYFTGKKVEKSVKKEAVRSAKSVKDEAVRSAKSVKDEAVRSAKSVKDEAVRSAKSVKDETVRSANSVKEEAVRFAGSSFGKEAVCHE